MEMLFHTPLPRTCVPRAAIDGGVDLHPFPSQSRRIAPLTFSICPKTFATCSYHQEVSPPHEPAQRPKILTQRREPSMRAKPRRKTLRVPMS